MTTIPKYNGWCTFCGAPMSSCKCRSDSPAEMIREFNRRQAEKADDPCVASGCKLGQWEILHGLAMQGRRCVVCNRVAVTAHLPEPI